MVYDLEATCNKAKSLQPVEIIELSACIIDSRTCSITAQYQAYVRPTEHPLLDPFCTQLTGIQQEWVDAAQPLQQVLQQHESWLQEQGLLSQGCTWAPVTWTDWDFKVGVGCDVPDWVAGDIAADGSPWLMLHRHPCNISS